MPTIQIVNCGNKKHGLYEMVSGIAWCMLCKQRLEKKVARIAKETIEKAQKARTIPIEE